jgi:branched-chain amino acid transport system ATP-binding protein
VTPLLRTEGLQAFHGDFQALFGIDLEVHAGEVIAIIGANGAGKSTFLRTLTGLLPTSRGAVLFDGEPIGGMAPGQIARRGIAMVPEGRRLFASLSVEENLLMGAHAKRPGRWNLESVYALFPVLRERRAAPATTLSGGQQQMAAIGRALMSNPRLLLCDELSLGLAPIVAREIHATLPRLVADGITLVVIEQDVAIAQAASDRLYCFQEGRVSLAGQSSDFSREQVSRAYFGI